jgi:hypothetical protein
VHGTFHRVLPHKGFGFVDVVDQLGNRQALFVHLGPRASEFRTGHHVIVEAVRNYKGISGRLTEEAGPTDDGVESAA